MKPLLVQNHAKLPSKRFSLLYSLVLDLAWLEVLDEMLAWNSQAKTFLLFQSCHPRAPL